MPEHLRGHICKRMRRHVDPDEVPPDWWYNPNYPNPRNPDSPAVQADAWRAVSAFRRTLDEKRAWGAENGYVRPNGHVDWQQFPADQCG